jgi:hypothetical protein
MPFAKPMLNIQVRIYDGVSIISGIGAATRAEVIIAQCNDR